MANGEKEDEGPDPATARYDEDSRPPWSLRAGSAVAVGSLTAGAVAAFEVVDDLEKHLLEGGW